MIDVVELLKESGIKFYQYKAAVLFRYSDRQDLRLGAEKVAEMVRALPGVTRVSTIKLEKDRNTVILNVRLISQKQAKEAYVHLKKNALEKFQGNILEVRVATNTIETKNFIK